MTVYLVKKEKHKIYKSEELVMAISGKILTHNEKGAPLLEEGYISITDTKNYWACAFSDIPVGIDMEEVTRDVRESVLNRLHKSEAEYMRVLSYGSSEWKEEFFNIWTKKESYSKYLGKGFGIGFSKFSVLEEYEHTLECNLYNKRYKDLILGATQEIEIEEYKYSAPLEKSALEAGADILDMFGCSANTLKEKLLKRGYSLEAATEAVEKLLERGYLNDDEYSRSLAEKYANRGYSSRRIEIELIKKGVSKAVAGKYRFEYKDGDRERARKLVQGMEKEKAARKLNSSGYDTYIIYDIIDDL